MTDWTLRKYVTLKITKTLRQTNIAGWKIHLISMVFTGKDGDVPWRNAASPEGGCCKMLQEV